MAQSGFPFDMSGDADGGDAPRGTDRRTLVLAGGLAAVLALGAGYHVLGGSDDDAAAAVEAVVRATPRTATTPVPTTVPATVALAKVAAPFRDDLGRDPFRALYVLPAVSTRVDPTDPTLTLPTPPAPAAPVPATAPDAPEASPALPLPLPLPVALPTEAVPVEAPPTAPEHALVLTGVRTSGAGLVARFTVDGTPVSVTPMSDFGPTGEVRLLSLQQGPGGGQWTAVLQVGDGQPFDAVTGEKVSVR